MIVWVGLKLNSKTNAETQTIVVGYPVCSRDCKHHFPEVHIGRMNHCEGRYRQPLPKPKSL